MLDQRCACALNVARQQLMHLSLAEFKVLVRDQALVLRRDRDRAVEALATMVPEAHARKELLQQLRAIIGAGGPLTTEEHVCIDRMAQVLPIEEPVPSAASARNIAAE